MKRISLLTILLFFSANTVFAMSADGCGAGVCADCHAISKEETEQLLGGMVDKVNRVDFSELPGMWIVEVEKDGQKLPVFIDFSKQFLVSGNVIRLNDKKNLTREHSAKMNRVDVRQIPLADALILGNPAAKKKVIVFTDPECPYCKKLHDEMKEVVRRDPDVQFLIKLFPLEMHPNAYGISKSIVCNNSMEYLERSFSGMPVPPPNCDIPVIDETIALAKKLGIRSTPTLVLPNGLVLPGYRQAEAILTIIGDNIAQGGL